MHPTHRHLRKLGKQAIRVLIVLALGGFLGATLVRIAPGYGVDQEELDSRLSNASIEALRQSHARQDNLARFYLHYWGQLLRGNLGVSQSLHEPVRQLLAERFPETLKSVGLALALAWPAALAAAVIAVLSRTRVVNLVTSLLASVLLCIPAGVLALLFVLLQAPGRLVLGLIVFPTIFYYARNLLLRSAARPHVVTAWAKGLGGLRVLLWHILPVAAPQLFALAGVSASIAFASAIPVEVLCDLPGIGQLAWQAALSRDLVLLVNLTMIVTLITLLANSAADLMGQSLHTVKA